MHQHRPRRAPILSISPVAGNDQAAKVEEGRAAEDVVEQGGLLARLLVNETIRARLQPDLADVRGPYVAEDSDRPVESLEAEGEPSKGEECRYR